MPRGAEQLPVLPRWFTQHPAVQGAKHYSVKVLRTLLLAILVYAGFQSGPPVYESLTFNQDLDLYALDAATGRLSESQIRSFLVREARNRGLQMDTDEVEISLQPAEKTVQIKVSYHAPVDLLVTDFTLDFDATARRHALPTAQEARQYRLP